MQKINSDATAKLASDLQSMQTQNPANLPGKTPAERVRVPMTQPMRKLETPELPGYWLQWIRGTPERMAQARRAFFEVVYEHELDLNNHDLGGDAKTSGNTDMGTEVSTGDGSGEVGPDHQPIRMILMKQKKEYHDEDVAITQARNDSVVDSLKVAFSQGTIGAGSKDGPGETAEDVRQRYVGSQVKVPDLFRRKA